MFEKQTAIGIDSSLFGLHSFRLGDASAAANSGMPDRLFKRQSRWSSEIAKDGYVKILWLRDCRFLVDLGCNIRTDKHFLTNTFFASLLPTTHHENLLFSLIVYGWHACGWF